MFIRKFRKLTVKMDKLPCFDNKFMGLHLHSLLPLWTDNAFATIGLLTRPQLPLVTTETTETLLCSSGPSLLFSSLCFLSSVNYTDWNILHLIWEKRKSQAKPFYLCQWILDNSGPASKAGTSGHKHHSHGKVCRKPQFVFSLSAKRFHCSS